MKKILIYLLFFKLLFPVLTIAQTDQENSLFKIANKYVKDQFLIDQN